MKLHVGQVSVAFKLLRITRIHVAILPNAHDKLTKGVIRSICSRFGHGSVT